MSAKKLKPENVEEKIEAAQNKLNVALENENRIAVEKNALARSVSSEKAVKIASVLDINTSPPIQLELQERM